MDMNRSPLELSNSAQSSSKNGHSFTSPGASWPTKFSDRRTPLRLAQLRDHKPSLLRLMNGNSSQQADLLELAESGTNGGP